MLAAACTPAGAARLVEVADPKPGAGQVRVRLHVAAVDRTDGCAHQGPAPSSRAPLGHPDGAGVVDAVGAQVHPGWSGQRVWVYLAGDRQPGTAAQHVCLPRHQVVALPDHVPFEQGAGLGRPYLTAHRCLLPDGGIDGRTVLVAGGGAVGYAATQLARWAGAEVIATAAGDDEHALVTAAGAETVVDAGLDGEADRLAAAAPQGIAHVVDAALGDHLAGYLPSLADHAVISAHGDAAADPPLPAGVLRRANATVRFVCLELLTRDMLAHGVGDITRALQDDVLQPPPARRFPLEAIGEAHAAAEGDPVGRVLLDIP